LGGKRAGEEGGAECSEKDSAERVIVDRHDLRLASAHKSATLPMKGGTAQPNQDRRAPDRA
jgi:hypothetical protein